MADLSRVHVTHTYASSPEVVFDALTSPEGLSRVFGVSMKRVREGSSSPDGEGSVRRIAMGPAKIEETVLVADRPTHIEYTITKGGPLKDHRGIQHLTPTPSGGTILEYTIQFRGRVPGVATLFGAFTRRTLAKGLPKLVD